MSELSPVVESIAQSLNCYPIQPKDILNVISSDTIQFLRKIIDISNRIRKHKYSKNMKISDINEALTSRSMQPLIGYFKSSDAYNYEPYNVNEKEKIFVLNEPQIQITSFLRKPLPEYPKDIDFGFHWLAFEGEQTKIEENYWYVFVNIYTTVIRNNTVFVYILSF